MELYRFDTGIVRFRSSEFVEVVLRNYRPECFSITKIFLTLPDHIGRHDYLC